ncbi:hypothetical protein BIW11_11335 [Tropilaelaps mercedesae]|uniref:Uncharacterized protein n=1 Tax=Tropilaelaps mercedesae TaxID=418985 RepID=A0A1V9XBW9_9ACAR|nr:hypothetical protein BIW11_11335 [Tropilaelaps mercedesae]
MGKEILLLLSVWGVCSGQHLLPVVDVVQSGTPYRVSLSSATAKNPEFIRGMMQLQETMPVSYSLEPDMMAGQETPSSVEEELGQDPIAARLEEQEETKEAAKAVRNRREASTQESRDKSDYDRQDSSEGSRENDGPVSEFGFDRNAKAKLDEEMASAERAVAKYDKLFGDTGKFSTNGGEDGRYGGGSSANTDLGGDEGPYGASSEPEYGTSSDNNYGEGNGENADSGNNYATSGGDTGYRGNEDSDGNGGAHNGGYEQSNDNGYENNDPYSPASGNDYRSEGGGGDENGNDGAYRPATDHSDTSTNRDGDAGDRYDANLGDNYNEGGKSDYSNERDKGYNQSNDDDYGKTQDYANNESDPVVYGGNNQYVESGGNYKPVNREGSYSRSISFHEKPKPKLKPYREILEEEDRKGGGMPFEANDGYDGKTEGFDGNYKAEGFNGDDLVAGGGDADSGRGDDYGEVSVSREAGADGYGEKDGDGAGSGVSEASDRPRDNEEKYAALDGPDYESQRGTDYYDRNNGGRGGSVEASERLGTAQESSRILETIANSGTPQKRGGFQYQDNPSDNGRHHRRNKRWVLFNLLK